MQRRRDELRFLFSRAALARLARSVAHDDLFGHAAELSFYALFALFPFLLLVSAVAQGFIANPADVMGRMFVMLHRFVPAGTAIVLGRFFEGPVREHPPVLLSLGVLLLVWSVASGIAALLKTLSIVNCTRDARAWWKNRMLAVGLVPPAVLLYLAVLAVMTGPDLDVLLPKTVYVPHAATVVWNWLRWPALAVVVSIALSRVFALAPCATRRRARWISTGSVAAATIGSLVSWGLSTYADRMAAYAQVYGSIGDLMLLLLWIHAGVMGILLGAEIDMLISAEAGERVRHRGQGSPRPAWIHASGSVVTPRPNPFERFHRN